MKPNLRLSNPQAFSGAMLIAIALVVAGAFLAWSTVTLPSPPKETTHGLESDGVLTLPAALVVIGVLMWKNMQPRHQFRQGLIMLGLGLLVAAVALIDISDVDRIGSEVREQTGGQINASVGPGLYLTLVGGAGIGALGALATSFAIRPPEKGRPAQKQPRR